jgi:hypothetical protein
MTLPYDYTRCARDDCPLDCRSPLEHERDQ